MFDLNSIFEFSRNHCVAICAFLVPLNLLATSSVLLFLFLLRPLFSTRLVATVACFCALTLFLHVGTWLMVGVVMAPTFILLGLGTICLVINFSILIATERCQQLLQITARWVGDRLVSQKSTGEANLSR
jgi:hypothetical protein